MMDIDFFDNDVDAGFPSPAADYLCKRINLNDIIIKHPLSTFVVGCKGSSMVDAYIPPKAKLVVDRSITATNGKIVLAAVNGEFTVKYFSKKDGRVQLIPANPAYKIIDVTEEMELLIWGVVIHILINPDDL
ncbi:MAG: translesion error-prone DNA polymerase V autoproteolytic subunit [Ferruginibacter sp.]